jgi:hypothetical protein
MDRIDFKKVYKHLYSPSAGQPQLVTVPKMRFAMVDGQGDPNTSKDFHDAIGALYGTVYGLKFARKKANIEPDFTIGTLEGLWWNETGLKYAMGNKADWFWTVMIWLPDEVEQGEFDEFISELKQKKPNPALGKVRLEDYSEGLAVQILHIGPYDTEADSIELMTKFAAEQGYTQSGKHHEIYLSDPRRVPPEKYRTIVRHPVDKHKE